METAENPNNSISCECSTQKNAPVDFLGDSTCGIVPARKVLDMARHFDSVIATESKRQSYQSVSSNSSKHGSSKKSTGNNYTDEYIGQRSKSDRNEYNEKESSINQHQSSTGTLEPKRSFIGLNKATEYEPSSIPKSPLPSSYQSKTTIAKTPSGVRIITDIYFDNSGRPVDSVIGSHVETVIPPSKILAEFQEKTSPPAGN